MTKIISLVNQKGGVGKTTTSINLAASLGKLGKKTLIIDLDPQGNATTGLGVNKGNINYSVYDVLNGSCEAKKAVRKTGFTNLSIIPATINLAGIDIELMEKGYQNVEFKKNEQLRNALATIMDNYDYMIIDCPPSLGLLTTNALVASDSVIIPVQCEYFALEGLTQLLSTIRLVQKLFNPGLSIEGVLLTMFDVRTKLSVEVQQEVRKYFKEKVYRCYIPRNVRLSEAPSREESIFEYDTRSEGAKAYAALVKEVITQNEKGRR